MNNKLEESTINELLKLEESKYYIIQAKNIGMWGGMTTPLRVDGKVMLFADHALASTYLIRKDNPKVNGFTSYGIEDVEVDDEDLDKYFVINELEDIDKEVQALKDRRAEMERRMEQERDELYIDIEKALEQYDNKFVKLEKPLYCKILIRTYREGSEFAYATREVVVLDKIEDQFTYLYESLKLKDRQKVIDKVLRDVAIDYNKLYEEDK